jgi:integrase
MPSIKKRLTKAGEVRWDAQVYVGRNPATRKPQFLLKTFEREKDAKGWARVQESIKDKGGRPSTTKETLAQYLTRWLDIHAGQVRPVTIYNYRKTLQRWVIGKLQKEATDRPRYRTRHKYEGGPHRIGLIQLNKLTVDAFDDLYLYMRNQGIGPRGMQYMHGILKRALNDAVRKAVISANPAQFATPPKQLDVTENEERVRAMDKRQAATFLAAAREDRYSALWHVLLLGMLRPCEAFALKWSDVDFEVGRVSIRHSLTRNTNDVGRGNSWELTPPKTKKSRRMIPLPPFVMRELKLWQTQQKKDRLLLGAEHKQTGFVFTTEIGSPLDLSNLYRGSFRRVMERAGLGDFAPAHPRRGNTGPKPKRRFIPGFRVYDLRHSGATLLLEAGENIKVVSERLGHSSIVLTADVYSHVLPTMQQAAAEKLEAMFA